MKVTRLEEAPGYDADRLVAAPLMAGAQCSSRIIRLSPGQELPGHRHGSSEVMLMTLEGEGELVTETGAHRISAGDVALYRGDEELRVVNTGAAGLTLFAFFAPPFPADAASRA
jgi:quercetin dioxygenase-like cupin family protein